MADLCYTMLFALFTLLFRKIYFHVLCSYIIDLVTGSLNIYERGNKLKKQVKTKNPSKVNNAIQN